jgi:hypothetical protein
MRLKKSWKEKLTDISENKDLPKVVDIGERMSKRWGAGTCVVPAPLEVDALMKKVPKGKLVTINEIRGALARKHKATIGCPMTTGIFAWMAAHAAAEDAAAGKKRITPYWRTLKSGGELNPKYPGGVKHLTALLRSEGHAVTKKGRRYLVADFEKSLARL